MVGHRPHHSRTQHFILIRLIISGLYSSYAAAAVTATESRVGLGGLSDCFSVIVCLSVWIGELMDSDVCLYVYSVITATVPCRFFSSVIVRWLGRN